MWVITGSSYVLSHFFADHKPTSFMIVGFLATEAFVCKNSLGSSVFGYPFLICEFSEIQSCELTFWITKFSKFSDS